MYKVLALLLVVAVVAQAGLIHPLVSGISHTQRFQSHIPIGIGKVGIGGIGLGIGLHHGIHHGIGLHHGLLHGGIIG